MDEPVPTLYCGNILSRTTVCQGTNFRPKYNPSTGDMALWCLACYQFRPEYPSTRMDTGDILMAQGLSDIFNSLDLVMPPTYASPTVLPRGCYASKIKCTMGCGAELDSSETTCFQCGHVVGVPFEETETMKSLVYTTNSNMIQAPDRGLDL